MYRHNAEIDGKTYKVGKKSNLKYKIYGIQQVKKLFNHFTLPITSRRIVVF